MKKQCTLLLICILKFLFVEAQNIDLNTVPVDDTRENKNLVKINFVPLIWKTGSINYERKLSDKWTAGITANYRPESKVPFKSYLQDLFGDKNKNYLDNAFDIDKLSYGNWSLSPEFKFYPGKSGAFKGFYIASFFKYENVNIQYDYYLNWDYNGLNFNTDLPLDGNLNSFTGGIYIGIQWKLSTNWYLDWQIIGGNYGSGKLEISAKQNLTQEQQKEIREFAQDLQEEMNQIKYDVNDQGAKIWGTIPWAGLRTGVSIGYSF